MTGNNKSKTKNKSKMSTKSENKRKGKEQEETADFTTQNNQLNIESPEAQADEFTEDAANDDFEEIEMDSFEFCRAFTEGEGKNKKPKIGGEFTGKFDRMREGDPEADKGITGIDFFEEVSDGKGGFKKGGRVIISRYKFLTDYFSKVTDEEKKNYVYRITLKEVRENVGQNGTDYFVFSVARKPAKW